MSPHAFDVHLGATQLVFGADEQIDLPVGVEREHLALLVWETLEIDPPASADSALDPDGIKLATQLDSELESGSTTAISQQEFVLRTGGAAG